MIDCVRYYLVRDLVLCVADRWSTTLYVEDQTKVLRTADLALAIMMGRPGPAEVLEVAGPLCSTLVRCIASKGRPYFDPSTTEVVPVCGDATFDELVSRLGAEL